MFNILVTNKVFSIGILDNGFAFHNELFFVVVLLMEIYHFLWKFTICSTILSMEVIEEEFALF